MFCKLSSELSPVKIIFSKFVFVFYPHVIAKMPLVMSKMN